MTAPWMQWLGCLVVLALIARPSAAVAPGGKVTISEAALVYIKDVALQQVLAQLSSVTVPDQSGSSSTPVGTISYDLKNIVITDLSLPDSTIDIDPNVGLTVAVANAACTINLDWSFREDSWPHVSDSGSATITVSQMAVSVTVAVGLSAERPTVSVTHSSVSIGNFNIDVHGGAAWLENWLISLFSSQIKGQVQSAVQSAVVSAVDNQGEAALASIPIEERIDQFSTIDYAMLAVPTFTATSLTSQHLGQFLCNHGCPPSPWDPVSLPDALTSDGLNVVLAVDVALSAGYVYFMAGALTTTVDSVPAAWPIQLNTSYFALIVPALAEMYPNTAMSFTLDATAPPVATVNASGATGSVEGVVQVYVHPVGRAPVEVFTLGLVIDGTGRVAVYQTNITAKVAYLGTALTLLNSSIGEFDVETLQDFVDFAVQEGFVPWLNRELGVGFPLPVVDGVAFTDVAVVYGDGFVGIGANFTYTPLRAVTDLGLHPLHPRPADSHRHGSPTRSAARVEE